MDVAKNAAEMQINGTNAIMRETGETGRHSEERREKQRFS
jgi:hypothetical protein